MTILLHKPYLVKVTTKGEGVKNLTTWFMNDPKAILLQQKQNVLKLQIIEAIM